MDTIRQGQTPHLPTTASAMGQSSSRVRFVVKSTRDPLADDGPNVIRNLSLSPKKISAVYVYDQVGTQLFEQQCRTPEYYLRRAEGGAAQGVCR
jgi:uncharacterized SAM-dependent methyltransferase